MTNSKQQAAQSLDNVKPLMDERAELHMTKKRIEERIKELDETLRPVLVGQGELVHNGYMFKVDAVPGRRTVDYKAMAEDFNIDLEDYTKVGKPSSRFTVKPIKEV